MPRPSVPNVFVVCKECSAVFPVAHTRRDTASFCSRPCHDTWRYKQSLGMFWDKMYRCDHEEWCIYCCWPWKGVSSDTYGLVHIRNQGIGAHIVAWELIKNQPFPANLQVAHYCHFRPCCNPWHIHPATAEGNFTDSIRDHRIHHGEDHHNSKLTEETALEALRLKVDGWSNVEIAHHLLVSKSTIRNLMAGDIWKHLSRPTVLPKQKPGPRPKKLILTTN